MNSIFFILILLLSFVNDTFELFRSHIKHDIRQNSSEECCIPPKLNIDSKKSNLGKDFLRQLTIPSDLDPTINLENICNLMHFLFQQASINNKPIIFTEGMFILFDSSNQVFNRLIKARKPQQSNHIPNTFNPHKIINSANPLRYLDLQSLALKKTESNTTIQTQTNDRYPTYGIDIPDSCLPGNFDHILLGELPSFSNDFKYNGKRMFIKPDRFGIEKTKISSVLNGVSAFIVQKIKQEFCRFTKGETKIECAKLRAFKENTDKKVLKKWKKVLLKLPLKWNIHKSYNERAIKYGIQEMNQQSKDLEAAGIGKYVKHFRKFLIQQYGQDDITVRKGREIIFTTTQLKQTHPTCQEDNSRKKC